MGRTKPLTWVTFSETLLINKFCYILSNQIMWNEWKYILWLMAMYTSYGLNV